MQFHFRISHNAYSLSPEVCLHQHLLFLNLLADNDAFSDYYSLGDHQFLFQDGDGEGAIWEGLYLPRVFFVRVDALHLNVLNILRLVILMARCLKILPYLRITQLAHTIPTNPFPLDVQTLDRCP